MLKYTLGQQVTIVSDHNDHNIPIGATATVSDIDSDGNVCLVDYLGKLRWVDADEVEHQSEFVDIT